MGKAVQHPLSLRQPGHCQPVVLLVQEKTGLLAVFHVHPVINSVFTDFGDGIRSFLSQRKPALVLFQTFQRSDRHIVSLIDAANLLAIGPENLHKQRKYHGLDTLHAHGQGLGHQNIR